MDRLFRLYRYLDTSSRADTEGSYTNVYRALEQVINLLEELDSWGQRVAMHGGFGWSQARTITERITETHRTALCEAAGQSSAKALENFIRWTHLTTEERQALIKLLETPPQEDMHG